MRPSGLAPSQSSASSGDNTRNSTRETSAPVSRAYAAAASSSVRVPHSVASFPANGGARPSFSSHSAFRPPDQNPIAFANAEAVSRDARSACQYAPPCSSPDAEEEETLFIFFFSSARSAVNTDPGPAAAGGNAADFDSGSARSAPPLGDGEYARDASSSFTRATSALRRETCRSADAHVSDSCTADNPPLCPRARRRWWSRTSAVAAAAAAAGVGAGDAAGRSARSSRGAVDEGGAGRGFAAAGPRSRRDLASATRFARWGGSRSRYLRNPSATASRHRSLPPPGGRRSPSLASSLAAYSLKSERAPRTSQCPRDSSSWSAWSARPRRRSASPEGTGGLPSEEGRAGTEGG